MVLAMQDTHANAWRWWV